MAGPSVEIVSLSACRSQANARRWGRRAQYQEWNFSYTVLRVRSKKWMSRFMIGPAGACPDKNHALSHARAQRRSPHGAQRNAGTPVPDYAVLHPGYELPETQ
jgi:hypothetical protein